MKKLSLAALAAMLSLGVAAPALAQAITPEKGKKADLVLLPKFLGILVFDQANEGAQEAHKELGNTGELLFLGRRRRIPSRARSKSSPRQLRRARTA